MEIEKDMDTVELGNIMVSPRHLGDRLEIQAAHKRLMLMLPNANSMPVDVLWSLAQLAIAYRLDPFNGEIYAVPVGKEKIKEVWQDKYVVMIGIKGFRVLAHRQSHFTIAPARRMLAEEVQELRRDLYMPEDIGVEVQLFRLDVARECKMVGVPYFATIGRGFWRLKAKPIKDQRGEITGYRPDNIPETWSALEVAEKRAEKAAITKAFDLRLDPQLFADEDAFEGAMHDMADNRERVTAITARESQVITEDDGDVIYAKS